MRVYEFDFYARNVCTILTGKLTEATFSEGNFIVVDYLLVIIWLQGFHIRDSSSTEDIVLIATPCFYLIA